MPKPKSGIVFDKIKLLGIFDIAVTFIFSIVAVYFFLFPDIYNLLFSTDYLSQKYNISREFYIFILIIAAVLMTNLFFSIIFITQSIKKKLVLHLGLFFLFIPIWLMILFIGYFFGYHPLFIFCTILLVVFMFWLCLKTSKKTTVFLILITLVFVGFSFFQSLKEEYCTQMASKCPQKDVMIYALTDDEKKFLKNENAAVSGWLRMYELCYANFDFSRALAELYIKRSVSTVNISVPRDKVINFVVEKNDTLDVVAKKFNISVDTIRWANNLSSDTSIKEGQTLKIPPVTGVVHIVIQGDTLKSIAEKYRVKVANIFRYPFNYITGENQELNKGQVIVVPEGKLFW